MRCSDSTAKLGGRNGVQGIFKEQLLQRVWNASRGIGRSKSETAKGRRARSLADRRARRRSRESGVGTSVPETQSSSDINWQEIFVPACYSSIVVLATSRFAAHIHRISRILASAATLRNCPANFYGVLLRDLQPCRLCTEARRTAHAFSPFLLCSRKTRVICGSPRRDSICC